MGPRVRNLLQQFQVRSPTTSVTLDRGMQEQEWLPEVLGGSDVDRLQLKETSIPELFLESRAVNHNE